MFKCFLLINIILFFIIIEISLCNARNINLNKNNGNEYELRMHPVLNFKSSTKRLQKRAMPTVNFQTPLNVEKLNDYWNGVAQNILKQQLKKNSLNTKKAKNVILFLGDGMSLPTITAGRVYMGGEEKQFSFETFPYVGLSKTYCANTQVADSACSATAYLSGIKGNYGTIGVTSAVDLNNCEAQNNTENHASSIAEWAQANNMLTGLITTTAVTHASPAGVYAHIANRNWENDAEIKKDINLNNKQCNDVAKQLIYNKVGHNLAVVMGGGREQFLPVTERDILGGKGKRMDNENLIKRWLQRHNDQNTTGAFVQTKNDLFKLPVNTDFVLGLFGTSHLPYHLDTDENKNNNVPTLAEMVSKAIDIFESKNQGYFLFVEGGRIDHAHHDTEALKALDETVEFDKAVKLARRRTNEDDTLIVVTSDHSHTMSMAGYSSRKNDILGINNGQIANDQLPYATLSYANGPGFNRNYLLEYGKRRNLKDINMNDKNYKYPSMVPLDSETHGGDDVAVFASGPFAHIFSGAYEQNFIPHAIAYASCIGNLHTSCSIESEKPTES